MFGLSCVGSSPAFAVDTIQQGNGNHIRKPPEHDPSYAKWSRLAFQEAGKVYTLLDYKYIGKSKVAPGVVQQQFRFWVKKNGAEFPLIVSIRYDPVTEKVFTILMEQENRGTLRIL
ncbi:DUF3889 domain-containing protein [Paenibacillus sp. Soil766]|uniref:DUF3889 domain-containing protein n=1 Tax=Paenibacillus sp. Soil766 TaxID=1736404 RepID=UPI0009E70EFB|nr:DUF3889 domain-containing protein [Paenibacillus sp. Soil766]